MCGIAGFTGFENNYELALNANEIQKHRGPDHQETWSDSYISFAHQRLSIIDLSTGANQPFERDEYIIVFNGEIYNFRELRKMLERDYGIRFTTQSDTEVLLVLYQTLGRKCLNHLIGMFAFAIYNKRTKELFIARDHFGIKPLFYTQIGQSFAFASELKTLIQTPGFDKSINKKALISCLNYLWVSGNESMFNNCFKLPPAHFLVLKQNAPIEIQPYWKIEEKQEISSLQETIVRLSTGIQESVARHMVADVPVSSFLSGGLDSSLIVSLAKNQNSGLSTYTIGTSAKDKRTEQMPDDEKFARELAQRYSLPHNVIKIQPDIVRDLPKIVRSLDEPIGDPAAINTYIISRAARDHGIKVLLSGMGADELFFGYRRQKATMLTRSYLKIPRMMRQIIQQIVGWLPVKIGQNGFLLGRWAKRFLSFAENPLERAYMRSYSYYDRSELLDLLREPYHNSLDDLYKEHRNVFHSKFNDDPVNQICHTDIHLFMIGLNLTYTDRASMAASVEVRVPYIDRELISMAMSIPGKWKFYRRKSKYILKKAAEHFLPSNIIYRKKASFGAPIRSWISKDLKGMVDDLLSPENIEKRGILNNDFVQRMIQEDRTGKNDYAYQIYQLLTLEMWFRIFVDQPQVKPMTPAGQYI